MASKREITGPGLSPPISHYCDATRWGDLLFVSGCAPVDGEGRLVGGADAAAQCRRVLENLGACLTAGGSSFADVLKVTVYLTDIEDRRAINPVRQAFFGAARPASTLIEVSRLAIPGMKVEIEAVAGVSGRTSGLKKPAARSASSRPSRRRRPAAAAAGRTAGTPARPGGASRKPGR